MLSCTLITQAVLRLQPGGAFSQVGDGLDGLTWLDEVLTRPTDPAIEAEVAVIEAEISASVTAELRKKVKVDRGATPEALVEALWQKIMETDSTAADALQVVRDQVDTEYPMIGE
jgi:hypothetical protein